MFLSHINVSFSPLLSNSNGNKMSLGEDKKINKNNKVVRIYITVVTSKKRLEEDEVRAI